MKKLQKLLLFCFILNTSSTLYAIAPVVDESENFANDSTGGSYASTGEPAADNLKPLAHDDNESSYFSNTSPVQQSVSHNTQDSAKQLNELQETVAELKAQVLEQNRVIEDLKKQQLTLYKDLDARISHPQAVKEDAAALPPEPKTSLSSKEKQNPADEQISYMAAYEFIDKKQFDKAQIALQEFIQEHPNSGYTPNAEYWLGELFLQEKNYAAAIAHFENVVNNYPSSNKAASSLYKLGYALSENGQLEEAKNKFRQVTQNYPDTDAARLASHQLNTL